MPSDGKSDRSDELEPEAKPKADETPAAAPKKEKKEKKDKKEKKEKKRKRRETDEEDRDRDRDRRRRRRRASRSRSRSPWERDRSRSRSRSRDRDKDRDRDRDRDRKRDRARDKSRDREGGGGGGGGTRFLRIGITKEHDTTENDIRTFLQDWSSKLLGVHLNTRSLSVDDPELRFHIAEMQNPTFRRKVISHFSKADTDCTMSGHPVKLQDWPISGHGTNFYNNQRERNNDEWRKKKNAPVPLLSEEFPDQHVIAFDPAEGKRFKIESKYVARSEGSVSMLKKLKEDGTILRRTICHHYKREGICRFGIECAYVHVKGDAVKTEMSGQHPRQDREHQQQGWQGGRDGAKDWQPPLPQRPPPAQPDGQWGTPAIREIELEGLDMLADSHYEESLLVRDVDKDTDARGIRRMAESDFVRMWCEIDGFVSAKLVREGEKQQRYGGSYGVVTFSSPEEATEALSQTFGHGLNISFCGVEEMLEAASTEQQLAMHKPQAG